MTNLDFELDGSDIVSDEQTSAKVVLSVHTIVDIPVEPKKNVAQATREYVDVTMGDDLVKFIDGCTVESEVIEVEDNDD